VLEVLYDRLPEPIDPGQPHQDKPQLTAPHLSPAGPGGAMMPCPLP
jgi:hypothetical protein